MRDARGKFRLNEKHLFWTFWGLILKILRKRRNHEENIHLDICLVNRGILALYLFSVEHLKVNPSLPNPVGREKIALLYGAIRVFMKALKALIKPFEAPQRSVKIEI